MRTKCLRRIFFLLLLCMSCHMTYASTMQLIYDGEVHLYENNPISLSVDGMMVDTTLMPPIQFNGYTVVPAREVFEQTGATVLWQPAEKKVYIDNDINLIVLEINNVVAWVDGEELLLDIPAKIINNKVMIPTRFVGEALGYEINWDAHIRNIDIVTKKVEPILPELPDVDEDQPGLDGEQPNVDENQPGLDGEQPNVDENQPGLDGEQPNVDEEWPDLDGNVGIIPPDGDEDIGMIEPVEWLQLEHLQYLGLDESFLLKDIENLPISNIQVTEDYHTKQIIVNLNGDYSKELPLGMWYQPYGNIAMLEIRQIDISTQLVITTRKIMALEVSELEGGIQLRCVVPSEKYDKIVVVDAGHGAKDSGTTYSGLEEKQLTLNQALALGQLLEQDPNIKVYLTREDDTFLELNERAQFANDINADLFISLHVNSAPSASASGIETYYTEKPDIRNKVFATIVQNELVEAFGTRDRGVKTNSFVVTKNTNVPAILVEIGFISNSLDREMMISEGFAERYAQVLYSCICKYFDHGYAN